MTLSSVQATRVRLIGDRSKQSAQINSVFALADFLVRDLDHLIVKGTGEIPEENKPIILESILNLNTALVMLYETLQQD